MKPRRPISGTTRSITMADRALTSRRSLPRTRARRPSPPPSSTERCRAPRRRSTPSRRTSKTDTPSTPAFRSRGNCRNNDALTVGYANTGGRNLEFLRNINLINPIRFLADGRPVYGPAGPTTRANPLYNNIALQDIGNNSSYNALIVNYQHRFGARGLLVNASYTWSHSIDDAPEANTYDQGSIFISDPTNRNRDRGNSSINRPNAFTLSTVWAPVVKLDNRVRELSR